MVSTRALLTRYYSGRPWARRLTNLCFSFPARGRRREALLNGCVCEAVRRAGPTGADPSLRARRLLRRPGGPRRAATRRPPGGAQRIARSRRSRSRSSRWSAATLRTSTSRCRRMNRGSFGTNLVDQLERLADCAMEALPSIGEAQPAIDAGEQRLPELLFERLDLAADRRLGGWEIGKMAVRLCASTKNRFDVRCTPRIRRRNDGGGVMSSEAERVRAEKTLPRFTLTRHFRQYGARLSVSIRCDPRGIHA